MGIKLSPYFPVMKTTVTNGKLVAEDVLGRTFKLDLKYDFSTETETFKPTYDVLYQYNEGDIVNVITKDGQFQRITNSGKVHEQELIDAFAVELPEELTEEYEYEHVGYYVEDDLIYLVLLDLNNKFLIHLVPNIVIESTVIRTFRLTKKFGYSVDLSASLGYALDNLKKHFKTFFFVSPTGENVQFDKEEVF